MGDVQADREDVAPSAPGRTVGSETEEAGRALLDAAARMFRLAGAALLLGDETGGLAWAVAAGELAAELGAAAETVWSGPGREAVATGAAVAARDADADPRWPALRKPGARRARSLLTVPIELDGDAQGVLVGARLAARPFAAREVDAMLAFAGGAAALLRLAEVAEARAQVVGQLEHALHHRVTIEQAKGRLMEREGLDQAAAFDRLRLAARAARRRVSAIAEEVVAGHPLDRPAGGDGDPP